MRVRLSAIVLALTLAFTGVAVPARSQLARFGPAGVVMGHVHLNVRDMDAQRKFWSALGGTPTQNGQLQMMAFPGVFVILRQQDPTGGSVGSNVNHIGFNVKTMADWLPKWKAAGLTIEPQTRPTQAFLIGP